MMKRKCHLCKQERPVQYYISEWQKRFMIPLPFSYCEECSRGSASKSRGDLMLYDDYVAQTELGCRLAPTNIAELC